MVLALAASPLAYGKGGAAAASPQAAHGTAGSYQLGKAQAATVLAARSDANSLAAAAALRYSGQTSKGGSTAAGAALALAARAVELAPQNPSISWLRLELCAANATCDVRDAATSMRWVDADNSAAWLPILSAAQHERDSTEIDRVLADMGHGARFDLYINRVVVLLADALYAARSQLPRNIAASDTARLATANEVANAETVPPFTALIDVCREPNSSPDRREVCLKLARTMQHSDTVAAQMAGFGIERHLLAADSKEARAVAERRHVLEWRVTEAAKLDDPLLPWTKNARARARLAQMRRLPREEDVCIAILQKHKMALEPPEVHP